MWCSRLIRLRILIWYSLFRYCHINCSRSPPRAEDELLKQPQPKPAPKPLAEGDETEIEIISEYSWRNFFSTINFLKILQKMTKHRAHRTYMLQQYKSSVSHLFAGEMLRLICRSSKSSRGCSRSTSQCCSYKC